MPILHLADYSLFQCVKSAATRERHPFQMVLTNLNRTDLCLPGLLDPKYLGLGYWVVGPNFRGFL